MNKKPTGRAVSIPAGLTWGGIVSLGSTLLFAAVIAKLLDMEKITWENVGYGVMCILLAASFLGAEFAYGKIKRQRIVVCLMSGLVYFVILLCITALFFGGQYEAVGVIFALVIGGSGCAGILGMREKGRRRAVKNKLHYR